MSDSPINVDAARRASEIADERILLLSDLAIAAIAQICKGNVNDIANVLNINCARLLSGSITGGQKHVNEILFLHDMKRRREAMENSKGVVIVVTSAMPPQGAAAAILGKKKNGVH